MSYLEYVKNHQSMMDKETVDTLGFSANPKKEKVYHKVRTSRDGSCTVEYIAPKPLGAREMKVAFTLATQCIDDDGKFIELVNESMVKTTVNLRAMAEFIYNKGTIDKRKSIFEALFRIKMLTLRFTYKDPFPSHALTDANGNHIRKDRDVVTGWIHEAVVSDNYETADVILSSIFLKYILLNPISFNLEKMISYDGRACFLYMAMQGYKYKIKRGNRWAYYHHVPHERLVQALDLVGLEKKKQIFEIKKAFKVIGFNYVYNKRTDNWDKSPLVK